MKLREKTITIPEGVTVVKSDNFLSFKGEKGDLSLNYEGVDCNLFDNKIVVTPLTHKKSGAIFGTIYSLINNNIIGVSSGYQKNLVVEGVGYKAELKNKGLNFVLGLSHSVFFEQCNGIDFNVKENVVSITGIDKYKVGEIAAKIRRLRKPNIYNGSGIRYKDEVIKTKVGKKV